MEPAAGHLPVKLKKGKEKPATPVNHNEQISGSETSDSDEEGSRINGFGYHEDLRGKLMLHIIQ